ncbi:hypothetical protein [Streptomyces gobitricini]|uniref:Uncharacterized protein n=1 Tax=Streptomyces gobitricini TaxID=68211 RepID=A0ABP6AID0_9ACTN
MTTLWRQVLAALTDDTLDDAEREAIVARSAARRASDGQQATPEAVIAVAFELVDDCDGLVLHAWQSCRWGSSQHLLRLFAEAAKWASIYSSSVWRSSRSWAECRRSTRR